MNDQFWNKYPHNLDKGGLFYWKLRIWLRQLITDNIKANYKICPINETDGGKDGCKRSWGDLELKGTSRSLAAKSEIVSYDVSLRKAVGRGARGISTLIKYKLLTRESRLHIYNSIIIIGKNINF